MKFEKPNREKVWEITGLIDKSGRAIREGDILLEPFNAVYGDVPSVVYWNPEYGSWCSRGDFAGGGSHSSQHGGHFRNCLKIGTIDADPGLFVPAKPIRP